MSMILMITIKKLKYTQKNTKDDNVNNDNEKKTITMIITTVIMIKPISIKRKMILIAMITLII